MTEERPPDESRPAAPIRITPRIALDPSEIEESFIRAGGPGGQHVNTTSSAVQLRFDVRRSPNLPDDVRRRLERLVQLELSRPSRALARRARPSSTSASCGCRRPRCSPASHCP